MQLIFNNIYYLLQFSLIFHLSIFTAHLSPWEKVCPLFSLSVRVPVLQALPSFVAPSLPSLRSCFQPLPPNYVCLLPV
jgi:hypothetical protein